MVCFLDDCTRNIMHSEFYDSLDQSIVQDCFRKALIKYGAPDCVYFDNGKQFRTHWMKRACGKLGIRLLYAKPYNPEGKGKQERYNQTVDSFLREALLEQLGIQGNWNRSVAKRQLHERVAALKAVDDVKTVCVVDESHLLSFEMLEEIRFLLNMKFDSMSPMALILAGQPELWERRLILQKCEAIHQRIDVQSVLKHYRNNE